MTRAIVALFLVVMACVSLRAQESARDKMLEQLQATVDDSVKFNLLRDIGYSYLPLDTSKALQYYHQAMSIAMNRKNEAMESTMLNDIGYIYLNNSQ